MQFAFAQAAQHGKGIVENLLCNAACRLFLFQVRTDIEVKLLAGVQHVFFGAHHQHGRQADVGREAGILDGYHSAVYEVCSMWYSKLNEDIRTTFFRDIYFTSR